MSKSINRRKFIAGTALSAAGVMLSDHLFAESSKKRSPLSTPGLPLTDFNLMEEVAKFRKIDAHVHVSLGDGDLKYQERYAETLIEYADRMKVDRLILSKPVTRRINGGADGSVESFIHHNNIVHEIVKLHPDRFAGTFTFNPVHRKETMEEIKRCVDWGMVGAKVYFQTKINDPSYYPVVEKFIDLKMIIHSHAEAQIGVGGLRMKYNGFKPAGVSIPDDFVDIAKRYPEAMFQYAHIGGGGDWEYMCKTLQNSPNVFVDTSGSNNEEHLIDFAVQHLGEDRLFFGSDNSYYQAVGKILASNLTDKQKKKIFFENFNNVLRKGGNNVN